MVPVDALSLGDTLLIDLLIQASAFALIGYVHHAVVARGGHPHVAKASCQPCQNAKHDSRLLA